MVKVLYTPELSNEKTKPISAFPVVHLHDYAELERLNVHYARTIHFLKLKMNRVRTAAGDYMKSRHVDRIVLKLTEDELQKANALAAERGRLMQWAMDSTFQDRDPVRIVTEFQKHFIKCNEVKHAKR